MKYYSNIDNITALEWGLNVQQAVLFDWLYTLPSWADSMTLADGNIVYFASRNKAIDELPLLTDKPDTVYRYYKQLEDLGLIVLVKFDKKDWIQLTPITKQWGRKSDHSEKNPNKLGKKSEQTRKKIRTNSEKNPTDHNTSISDNNNHNTSNQTEIDIWPTFEDFWDLYDKKVGRPNCEKKWAKLSQKEKESAMEYVPNYKQAQPNKQYRKNPETFLNQKSWNDEIISNKNGAEKGFTAQAGEFLAANDPDWKNY